ncbi:bifunctional metallophosphatase/5'-nucleotidase [Fidelibacter multiformis]|jgi:2',3'-cyclic-nucleotide 2'-phosphodiesterase (5'-nucleotidase family)|uniref:bifunctional metallophosphatase/5'-nucleotidase n=1 Tax=Fidelibacter multiformis TaxID=3377529 RepID=UPI0037DDAE90
MRRFTYILFFILISVSGLWGSREYPEEEYQKITLIFTNDIHGGVDRMEARFMNPEFPPLIGGGAAVVHYIDAVREKAEKENTPVLVVDAGDFFSGRPIGSRTEGEAVIKYMNMAGYDAMTVGNHDFDLGLDVLKARAAQANFPFLGANIIQDSTGQIPDYLDPYVMVDAAGIQIAILGISTTVTPDLSFPDHVAGLTFLPEIETARRWVPRLKEMGADMIIVETHAWTPYDRKVAYQELLEDMRQGAIRPDKHGPNALEIAAMTPDIDIMFSGHVHKGFYEPYVDPVNHTLIFQNYANGTNVGHVNVYIHKETKELAGYDFAVDNSALITMVEDEFWLDEKADSILSAEKAKAEEGFHEVLTVLPKPLRRSSEGQSLLGNMICDAMTTVAGADVAFSNFGGVRADLNAGPLTPADLFNVLPFGNNITVFQVSGSFIDRLIEDRVSGNSRGMLVSGLQVTVDRQKPNGDRVTIHSIQGKPFDPDATYTMAISDYLAEGNSGYGRVTEIPEDQRLDTSIMIRQALQEYITDHNGLEKTSVDNRWEEVE